MAAQPDLWGEIQVEEDLQTPITILRQQAALLGPKTQNLIESTVQPEPFRTGFRLHFYLVAPALDNYTYELFNVWHELGGDLYPVLLENGTELRTQEELLAWLKNKLSSPETKRIITNLVAQVKR